MSGTDRLEEVDLGPLADWPTERCEAAADGRVVIVAHRGEPVVLANRCAHQDTPIAGGWIRGDVLTCPAHFWRFRLPDGIHVSGDGCVERHETRLVNGRVLARIPRRSSETLVDLLRRHARQRPTRESVDKGAP